MNSEFEIRKLAPRTWTINMGLALNTCPLLITTILDFQMKILIVSPLEHASMLNWFGRNDHIEENFTKISTNRWSN